MASTPTSSGRRLARRLAAVVLGLVVLLAILVAAGPALIRAGLADGLVASRLGAAVSGDAGFDRLGVTWAGPQRIEGLRLTDASGDTVIAVDVTARHGLLALLTGQPVYDVVVTGEIDAAIDEDGRLSLSGLAAPSSSGSGALASGGGDRSATGDPLTIPPAFSVELDQMVVRLDAPETTGGPVVLDGLTGRVSVDESGSAAVDLRSAVRRAGRDGSFEATIRLDDLHDGRGRVELLAANVESLLVTADTISFISGGRPARVETARLEASGSPVGALDARLVVAAVVGAEGTDDATGEAASLDVALATRQLLKDGALDLAGADWSLVIPDARVPAGAIQPFVAGLGLDVARDVGPWVTVTADVSSDSGATSSVQLAGDAARLELVAARLPGTAEGTAEGTAPDRVSVTRLVASARVDPALAAAAGVGLARPVQLRVEAQPFSVALDALSAGELPSPLQLTADLEGGTDGPIEITFDGADGPTTMTLPAATIDASLAANGRVTAIVRADTATVRTPAVDGAMTLAPIELTASADRTDPAGTLVAELARVPVTIGEESFAVVTASVAGRPRPAAAGGPDPARPADPLDALAALASVDLTLGEVRPVIVERLAGFESGTVARWARSVVDVRLQLPAPADGAPARLTAAAVDPERTALLTASARGGAGVLAFAWDDTSITVASDELVWQPSNSLLARLLPTETETEEGPRPAAFTVRDAGDVRVRIDRIAVPRSLLAARPAVPAESGQPRLPDDPAGADSARPLDLATIAAALTAELDTLAIVPASGDRAVLPPVRLTLDAARLDEPRLQLVTIDAEPATDGETAAANDAPSIALDLTRRAGALDGTVTVRNVNVALVEAAAGTGDLLATVVGPRLAATATFAGFSPDAGSVDFEASGRYGRAGGRVRGEMGAFVIDAEQPVVASVAVHDELRDRLLAPIQPIFAGVTSSDGPVTLTVGPALVPLSDGIEAAVAEFRVESGRLQLESGFDLLSAVALFDRTNDGRPLEAQLTPITGELQAGAIVTGPARLVLTKGASIDILSGGRVDLVNQTLDYRATMPLKWLGSVFREARGLADTVTVPLVARGALAGATFEVDPSFDLGSVLVEAGLGSLLERELGPDGAAAGRLLEEILRGLGGGGGED